MFSLDNQQKSIYKVTLIGALINFVLVAIKFFAGYFGHSQAMIADSVHSTSDFFTDFIVIFFLFLGNRPADENHQYGYGKYETLATTLIGIVLLIVSAVLIYEGADKIIRIHNNEFFPLPHRLTLGVATASIILKEFAYQITKRIGEENHSPTLIANAWHHRTDAFSSVAALLGLGGAIFLGEKWIILDPIASIGVSVVILVVAVKLTWQALQDMLEHSLPKDIVEEIKNIVLTEPHVSDLHRLRTRRIGGNYAMNMHIRMPGDFTLTQAHDHCNNIERRLKEKFGKRTYVGIHIEPKKE